MAVFTILYEIKEIDHSLKESNIHKTRSNRLPLLLAKNFFNPTCNPGGFGNISRLKNNPILLQNQKAS